MVAKDEGRTHDDKCRHAWYKATCMRCAEGNTATPPGTGPGADTGQATRPIELSAVYVMGCPAASLAR